MVAIKKLLSADYKQHEMNFIYNGPKLQHKNVVKCLGYGVEKNVNWISLYKNITCAEKLPIWVEEYVPNGSLEKFLINGMFTHIVNRLHYTSLYFEVCYL